MTGNILSVITHYTHRLQASRQAAVQALFEGLIIGCSGFYFGIGLAMVAGFLIGK